MYASVKKISPKRDEVIECLYAVSDILFESRPPSPNMEEYSPEPTYQTINELYYSKPSRPESGYLTPVDSRPPSPVRSISYSSDGEEHIYEEIDQFQIKPTTPPMTPTKSPMTPIKLPMLSPKSRSTPPTKPVRKTIPPGVKPVAHQYIEVLSDEEFECRLRRSVCIRRKKRVDSKTPQ